MRFILLCLPLAVSLCSCNAGQSARGGVQQFQSGFGAAATAPLEDLNLNKDEIPAVLLEALTSPYGLRNLNQCRTIAAEIARLNEALGPDVDEPAPDDPGLLSERAADAAATAALDLVRDTSTDFIPGRSWIRRLSGAEQSDRQMQSAVEAGRLRRAFLKGVGMQLNCAPPAAPAWFRPRGAGRR
ncbi:hypothetical protein [Brevundimonas halotolerans]|uniref:Uncharacterized protein n=1 Tax=Brevundimonas halotolerans TaxID=69670 RepID=A0A7W9A1M6_9CAUL|nr:hypothetical protein [Brevundimonas halotolerans]MBB5659731.1 hypothetical protein [Brevundimonas halotolerans]